MYPLVYFAPFNVVMSETHDAAELGVVVVADAVVEENLEFDAEEAAELEALMDGTVEVDRLAAEDETEAAGLELETLRGEVTALLVLEDAKDIDVLDEAGTGFDRVTTNASPDDAYSATVSH